MVFDECHHTRKNHAYNGIMREYFQGSSDRRPKIFGMTASPIWNPKDAVESLATLERNLDAKVIAVRQHVDELMDHSPRPQEVCGSGSQRGARGIDIVPSYCTNILHRSNHILHITARPCGIAWICNVYPPRLTYPWTRFGRDTK